MTGCTLGNPGMPPRRVVTDGVIVAGTAVRVTLKLEPSLPITDGTASA